MMDRLPMPQPDRFSRRAFLRRAGLAAGALAGLRNAGPAAAGELFGRTLSPEALSIARVWPRTARQALALASFDETHALFPDGSAEVLLWPGDRKKLDRLGVEYRITTARLEGDASAGQRVTGVAPQPGERTAYRRLPDFALDMQALATQYPDKTRMFAYPEPSLEGRTVYGIEIATDVAQPDGRPVVHIDGVHHSREWPSAELPIMFAYDLLETYGMDERVTNILDRGRVVITPVMNPDGFHHSREAPTDTDPGSSLAYWRKNKRSYTDMLYELGETSPYLNADAHGTDPNRNYPFYWGGEGGNSDPRSQTYAGSAPYAEPESRNIAGMMKSRQFTSYLTNHTYGRLCMRPWGYTTDPSPDNDFQRDLGAQITAVNKYQNIIGLQLYPTAGTSRDWSYAALRTIVYTFEHGTSFHAAYLSTIPSMYALNRVPFLLICEAGIDPANHGVITGKVVDAQGAPLAGSVRARKSFATSRGDGGPAVPETIDTSIPTRPDGTFEFHVNPSTRPTVIQDGGGPEAWEVIVEAGGRTRTFDLAVDRGDLIELEDVEV